MKTGQIVIALWLCLILITAVSANPNPLKIIEVYQQQGASRTDANRGKQLWEMDTEGRRCTSCHGDSPSNNGSHIKTKKLIKPMALSVNPERYQDDKKIEKWFLRNCKWTFGRECNVQEKADILTWLSSQ